MKLTAYFIGVLLLGVTSIPVKAQKKEAQPDLAQLEKMTSRFAPTPLRVDPSRVSAGDRQALVKLIEAARILNDIFMKQMWDGNPALYARLQKDTTPLGKARLHYFWINKAPWSDLDEYKAFLPGVPPRKPLAANFYPESMTKEAFESWMAQLSPKEQEQAKSFFTVIRWRENSKPPNNLLAIPYSQQYADDLTRAANLLREAAGLTDNASLKKFLSLRADAFLSNDYYESDMAWMDLDAPLDITIGPYETYNDRVVQQKGSKRVMLKNVQEAKFRSVLLPIARRTLSQAAMVDVSFEPFFTHILAHELMHGLGPHQIKVQGRDTTPREELKELYSAVEEPKADVTGLFALQYMMDHAKEMGLGKSLPPDEAAQRQLYTTYLASAFRTLRFGLNDAHGKGMAIQFNYLMDKGAFVQHADGTFSVDMTKVKTAIAELDRDLLTIEAEGNYAGAKKMLDELGVMRPALRKALDSLQGIPTDIEPIFVTADELAPIMRGEAAAKPVRKKKRSK